MKFLCLQCDEPMAMETAAPPDASGSIAARFRCPKCQTGIAMLTNSHETQLVQSLGVKIGPSGEKEQGGCPFSGMITEAPADETLIWTAQALSRLERIPVFVRPMAKKGIESYARENGHQEINEDILEEARGRFGM